MSQLTQEKAEAAVHAITEQVKSSYGAILNLSPERGFIGRYPVLGYWTDRVVSEIMIRHAGLQTSPLESSDDMNQLREQFAVHFPDEARELMRSLDDADTADTDSDGSTDDTDAKERVNIDEILGERLAQSQRQLEAYKEMSRRIQTTPPPLQGQESEVGFADRTKHYNDMAMEAEQMQQDIKSYLIRFLELFQSRQFDLAQAYLDAALQLTENLALLGKQMEQDMSKQAAVSASPSHSRH